MPAGWLLAHACSIWRGRRRRKQHLITGLTQPGSTDHPWMPRRRGRRRGDRPSILRVGPLGARPSSSGGDRRRRGAAGIGGSRLGGPGPGRGARDGAAALVVTARVRIAQPADRPGGATTRRRAAEQRLRERGERPPLACVEHREPRLQRAGARLQTRRLAAARRARDRPPDAARRPGRVSGARGRWPPGGRRPGPRASGSAAARRRACRSTDRPPTRAGPTALPARRRSSGRVLDGVAHPVAQGDHERPGDVDVVVHLPDDICFWHTKPTRTGSLDHGARHRPRRRRRGARSARALLPRVRRGPARRRPPLRPLRRRPDGPPVPLAHSPGVDLRRRGRARARDRRGPARRLPARRRRRRARARGRSPCG